MSVPPPHSTICHPTRDQAHRMLANTEPTARTIWEGRNASLAPLIRINTVVAISVRWMEIGEEMVLLHSKQDANLYY